MMNLNIPGLKKGGNDGKYFTTTKKGEIHDLKQELHDPKPDRRKDAVKKVIAAMTVGKDVSALFPDVLNCMQTASMELKKLVYLYLINYAKTNPDMAILAVNTFRRDANDPNPLIRALAIRTMGCIRVDKITEYLCDPLRRALKDDDPYVRKTAAICVAKLYDISPTLAEEQGFVELLQELVSDSNPVVVSNAVAALSELASLGNPRVFTITPSTLSKLLAAISECQEWGQVYILDALANYSPKNAREAESIVERITPRLQHSNCAVVMGAVRVIVKFVDLIDNEETVKVLSRKMSPPLITLLSAEPEIQYIALRNINLIVQKHPTILSHEIRVFFCRYNDPIYVKMEKLELMVLLCSERNAEQVLLELKEYATEVDVDFVRKAVRAIGRIAIKLERSAEKCINVLLELIKTRVNYVVQESIIVIKDIFRRYPNRYESIIATLCENLDSLDEPEAKASMVWIVGEYASRIDNADDLLETFLDNFQDETAEVQLQLLTATVKLFLKRPEGSKELMENVLSLATEHSDNPDLRDRGYIYWRLLCTDPEAAKRIVLSDKPVITDDSSQLDGPLLNELITNISTLASIYHKPPDAFVKRSRIPLGATADDDDDDSDDDDSDDGDDSSEDGEGSSAKAKGAAANSSSSSSSNADTIDDILGLGFGSSSTPAPSAAAPSSGSNGFALDDLLGGDLLGGGPMGASAPAASSSAPILLENGALRLQGAIARAGSALSLNLFFTNLGATPLKDFKIQFNKNALGLSPTSVVVDLGQQLGQGASCPFTVPLGTDQSKLAPSASPVIDVALKIVATGAVEYFKAQVDFCSLLVENGAVDKKEFIADWKALGDAQQAAVATVRGVFSTDVSQVSAKLAERNVASIATRSVGADQRVAYFSCRVATGAAVLVELTFKQGFDACKLNVRSKQAQLLPVAKQAFESLLAK